jgi:oxygen-independent coproporphyrinogen-3 oxidase
VTPRVALALELAARRPHDFTIQYPPNREYFREHFRAPPGPPGPIRARTLLLYVHVPFCEARCSYCNFAIDTRRDETLHSQYVEALVVQLDRLSERVAPETRIGGIDIGGGTPTLLSERLLARLVNALVPWRRRCAASHPLSIETTPRIAAAEPGRLAVLAAGGVNRVSMGLQSSSAELLASVNRHAQRSLGRKAVANLRRAGFRRVNVDLIFALPGQTTRHWRDDLDHVADLPTDSITTYDCLYRGRGRLLTRSTPEKPGPEVYGGLYDLAYERLTAAGFHAPYGSVNFSRHPGETGTSPYFEGRLLDGLPYVGVGNYASSMVGDHWWFAPYRVGDWLRAVGGDDPLPAQDYYRLPVAERAAKYLLLSLSFGIIDRVRFRTAVGAELSDLCADSLATAQDRGWLRPAGNAFAVAPGAFRALPSLRALFYPEQAHRWMREQTGAALPVLEEG